MFSSYRTLSYYGYLKMVICTKHMEAYRSIVTSLKSQLLSGGARILTPNFSGSFSPSFVSVVPLLTRLQRQDCDNNNKVISIPRSWEGEF